MSNLTRTLLSWISSIEGQVTIHDGVAITADGTSVDLRQGLRDPASEASGGQQLTPPQRHLIRQYLLNQFPWLGNDDEDVSGADTVTELSDCYAALGDLGHRSGMTRTAEEEPAL